MNTSRWPAADGRALPHFERVLCAFDEGQPRPEALQLASSIAERFGASLETLHVSSGSPSDCILECAQRADSDLIVLGSRARSDLGWQFRTDVVREVSARAACSILTIHERDLPPAVERILLPGDLGPPLTPTLDLTAALSRLFSATIHL